jgi:hypothetical protein
VKPVKTIRRHRSRQVGMQQRCRWEDGAYFSLLKNVGTRRKHPRAADVETLDKLVLGMAGSEYRAEVVSAYLPLAANTAAWKRRR